MGLRHLLGLLAVTAFFAIPADAQPAGSVTIWLQLPKAQDLAAADRVKAADVLILKLLSEGAAKKLIAASDGKGPLLQYRASSWAHSLSLEERRQTLQTLSLSWGKDLRLEGGSPLLAAGGFPNRVDDPSRRPPSLAGDAALGLLSPHLTSGGDQGLFYDRSQAGVGSADPVFGRWSAGAGRSGLILSAPVKAAPLITPVPPIAPAWTTPYADIIQKAARDSGIDPELLRAVVAAKSKYQASLVSGGGYGLMAVSGASAKSYGYTAKDMLDPEKNMKVGSDILAALLKQFDGNVQRALAAYQAGPLAVLRSGGIPNDKNVRDFLGAVALAQDPVSRVAHLPVKPIRSALKFEVQKDLIELAQQARNGSGVARWRPIIVQAAERFGVDPHLMEAMVMQEVPSGNPRAVSPVGAQGLGQLMPATAAALGVKDPFDPVQNINGMARHIRHLKRQFDGDPVLVAAAYNAGEGTVGRLGRIPRYKETMSYVRRVFANYHTLTDEKVPYEHHMPPPVARPRKP